MIAPAIHATAVAIGGEALLIRGPSRAGKSRLAVALIARSTAARPIVLIGDDRILLREGGGRLLARPHPRIAGFLERRGLGIVAMDWLDEAPVGGVVDLHDAGRATPSPACGRRWPDEVGSDEGDAGKIAPNESEACAQLPHPTPLRGATIFRKREKGGLRPLPRLVLARANPDRVLAWWARATRQRHHTSGNLRPRVNWPRAKD